MTQKNFLPSPLFGLAEIEDSSIFKESIDGVCDNVMNDFWKNFSKVHHYGNDNEAKDNMGFPFLTYLISKKKIEHIKIVLAKHPNLATVNSVRNWSPLHEAVFQKLPTIIHLLMRFGADPDQVGSRDVIENFTLPKVIAPFGCRHISPKMMTKTFFKEMDNQMKFEISFRNKWNMVIDAVKENIHICTSLCIEEQVEWEKENAITETITEANVYNTDEDDDISE